jgi:hypothetical protein
LNAIYYVNKQFQEEMQFEDEAFKRHKSVSLTKNNKDLLCEEFLEEKRPLTEVYDSVESEIESLHADLSRAMRKLDLEFHREMKMLQNEREVNEVKAIWDYFNQEMQSVLI